MAKISIDRGTSGWKMGKKVHDTIFLVISDTLEELGEAAGIIEVVRVFPEERNSSFVDFSVHLHEEPHDHVTQSNKLEEIKFYVCVSDLEKAKEEIFLKLTTGLIKTLGQRRWEFKRKAVLMLKIERSIDDLRFAKHPDYGRSAIEE